MQMYTYTVYHIPGIKVGCTADFEKRMKDQGFTNWEILWQQEGDYEFGWVAGDKEIELQTEYGYKRDNKHYQLSRECRKIGGKIGGKSKSKVKIDALLNNRVTWATTHKYRDKETVLYNAKHNGGTNKHRDCQYCGRTINLMNIGRHENICKIKKEL